MLQKNNRYIWFAIKIYAVQLYKNESRFSRQAIDNTVELDCASWVNCIISVCTVCKKPNNVIKQNTVSKNDISFVNIALFVRSF